MRIIVAWSAALTLLYTPLLKRMTGVKNVVVAAIIAASPLSGALAAGAVCDCVTSYQWFYNLMHQAAHALSAVLATCTWAFLSVLHREVLMDITDVDGDRAAGVLTMPVVLGRPAALLFATACVAVASAYGMGLAVYGNGLAWLVCNADGTDLYILQHPHTGQYSGHTWPCLKRWFEAWQQQLWRALPCRCFGDVGRCIIAGMMHVKQAALSMGRCCRLEWA